MLPRIHFYKRIANNVFKEWSDVNLAQDEAEGVGISVAKHHELVPRQCFIDMKLVCRRAVVHKLFISTRMIQTSGDAGCVLACSPSRQFLDHVA